MGHSAIVIKVVALANIIPPIAMIVGITYSTRCASPAMHKSMAVNLSGTSPEAMIVGISNPSCDHTITMK